MSNTDNFDSPDDLDQVLDKDVDFDDFEDGKDKSLGASWKQSPLFKFGIVAVVIVIVIGLVSIFGGDKVQAPTSVVGKGAGANFKQAPGINEVSPVMKEAIEEKNDQRIDEAQKQGISAIPTPIAPPKTLLEVPQDDAQSEDPLLRWQQMQTERAKAQREQQLLQDQQVAADPQREAKINELMQGMVQQMSSIYGNMKPKDLQHMKVFNPADLKNAVDANGNVVMAGGSTLPVDPNAIINQKPAKVIVPAGKIEYAQMILEANSDIPGPVLALMASGTFSGSKLIGKFTKQEDYLVITFTQMVTKKGTSVPINAYALDPGTSLTGVATDVDHRYLKRIILPAAAKFVQGLGDAYAETTTSTTQNATTTTTSSENLDPKQEMGKAVGDAAETVGEILQEDGKDTESLVIVAAGTPLGILFMDPITDKTVLQARAGGAQTTGQQQYPNQQQQMQNGYGMQNQQGQQGFMNQLQQLQYGLQGQQYLQQNGGMGNMGAINNGSVTQTSGQK